MLFSQIKEIGNFVFEIKKINLKKFPLFILHITFLLLLYIPNFLSLINWWISELRYQVVVILLFFIMLVKRKREIYDIPVNPESFGYIFFCTGLLLLTMGRFSANHILQEFSFVLTLYGILFLNFGVNYVRILFLPVLYLLFASHIFYIIPDSISFILQIVSTKIATLILHIFGYNILVNGTYIRLPATTLHVVDLCSGYNQLFTLLALMIPLAYISHKSPSKQVLLIGLCFPVGIFFNSLRIALIGIYNYSKIREHIHGPYEIYRMPFIFLGGLVLMTIISNLMTKSNNKRVDKIVKINDEMPHQKISGVKKSALLSTILLFISLVSSYYPMLLTPHSTPYFTEPKPYTGQLPPLWNVLQEHENSVTYENYYEMPLKPKREKHQLFITPQKDSIIASILWFANQFPGNEPFYFSSGKEGEKQSTSLNGVSIPLHITIKADRCITTAYSFGINNTIVINQTEAFKEFFNQILTKRTADAFLLVVQIKSSKNRFEPEHIKDLLNFGFEHIMENELKINYIVN